MHSHPVSPCLRPSPAAGAVALLFPILILLAPSPTPIRADAWAAQPIEVHLMEADLVVSGKIVEVKEGKDGILVNKRPYSLARLESGDLLKGEAPEKGIEIAFPSKHLIASDVLFKKGDEGVWILKQDNEGDFYWAASPMDHQDKKVLEPLRKAVHQLSELKWGDETNGLSLMCKGLMAADVEIGVPIKPDERPHGPGVPALSFYVKNRSTEPVWLCNYAGDRPVSLEINGPDGLVKPDLYLVGWRVPINKANYLHLRPGAVRAVGGVAGVLKIASLFSKGGDYKITAVFTAKRDGKEYKFDHVWTGELRSNEQKMGLKVMGPG